MFVVQNSVGDNSYIVCEDVAEAFKYYYPEAFEDDPKIDDPGYAQAVEYVREHKDDPEIDPDATGLTVYELVGCNTHAEFDLDGAKGVSL